MIPCRRPCLGGANHLSLCPWPYPLLKLKDGPYGYRCCIKCRASYSRSCKTTNRSMLGGPRGQASELRPRSIRTNERSLCRVRVPRRIHPTKFPIHIAMLWMNIPFLTSYETFLFKPPFCLPLVHKVSKSRSSSILRMKKSTPIDLSSSALAL